MALFLGLLRCTHLLSRHSFGSARFQLLYRGMRRCCGLVLGIIGRLASARSLTTWSLAFKMSVLYFDVHQEMPNLLILPHSADYSEEVWMDQDQQSEKQCKESALQICDGEQLTNDFPLSAENCKAKGTYQPKE